MRKAIELAVVVALAVPVSAAPPPAAGGPSEPPVAVSIAVAPGSAAPGSDVAVTVKLSPRSGIKLNKYPKIKLTVPAEPGLVAAAEGAIGNAAPPSADHLEANYYKGVVDPLVVQVHLERTASPGAHDVSAKLSYFYCVAASGYCAPAKVDVTVPILVR